jgi:peptide/nickel transport system substrate-binding protein
MNRAWLAMALALLAPVTGGCRPGQAPSRPQRTTLAIAAVGEPSSLLPPLVTGTVGRDIGDQVYERLADLAPGSAPIDTTAYRPRLASRWERVDPTTWRFHLRPGARWQDGRPVTAEDVQFSFEAFSDSLIDSPARGYLAGQARVTVEDRSTFLVRFATAYPEQLYDATYHVRVIPKHIWDSLPKSSWAEKTDIGLLVGSGPYRVREWKQGQHVRLDLDSLAGTGGEGAHIDRLVWRFTQDPDAALNLVLSGEADLLESVGSPAQQRRFEGKSDYELRSYPGATYGFLAFRLADRVGKPHPIFGSREVRRALSTAIDRPVLARTLLGPETRAPSGPMSRLLWIQSGDIAVLPYDTAAAARALDSAGWRKSAEVRRRGGTALRFDILVPATSATRKQAALILQESWRRLGAEVTVTAVEYPVFESRLRSGVFDSYIGAYLDEPSARGLADQWTRAGWGILNFGRFADPVFDSLFNRAAKTADVDKARSLYREAMDTLNTQAPALFLYAPSNVAAIRKTLENVRLDPYSWLSDLPNWKFRGEDRKRLAARENGQR